MSQPRHKRLFDSSILLKKIVKSQGPLRTEITSRQLKGVPTLFANTYRALVRIVGFFKYNLNTGVFLRGQSHCHRSMLPSAYRGSAISDGDLDQFLTDYRAEIGVDAKPAQAYSTEPLLQHYGIRTRWLDVVDSIPHAIYFSINVSSITPWPKPGKSLLTFLPSLEEYGFIYLIDCGKLEPIILPNGEVVPGAWRGDKGTEVCDLRIARASNALRPHAQHGLLIRQARNKDIWNQIIARIAIPVESARSWLGSGEAFSRTAFFPPTVWDNVYGSLLGWKVTNLLTRYKTSGIDLGHINEYDFLVY